MLDCSRKDPSLGHSWHWAASWAGLGQAVAGELLFLGEGVAVVALVAAVVAAVECTTTVVAAAEVGLDVGTVDEAQVAAAEVEVDAEGIEAVEDTAVEATALGSRALPS